MLVCRDVTELTTDYLEGALPIGRRLAMRFHLAICSFCRRHIKQVRDTVALLHRMPPQPVPPVLEDRLMAQVEAGEADRTPPDPPS